MGKTTAETVALTHIRLEAGTVTPDQVALAGDWHGDAEWAVAVVEDLDEQHPDLTLILHLGDFGIWPGLAGQRFLNAVEGALAERGMVIAVTPGKPRGLGPAAPAVRCSRLPPPYWASAHVAVLPPGYRFTLVTSSAQAQTFVSLGGAPSMDRTVRTPGVDWWPSEEVTDEDVERVAEGGHADVMLAHDAPNNSTPAVTEVLRSTPPREWLPALPAAMAGRRRMDRAFAAVLPDLYIHGHYHVHDDATLRQSEVGDRMTASEGSHSDPGAGPRTYRPQCGAAQRGHAGHRGGRHQRRRLRHRINPDRPATLRAGQGAARAE